MTSELPFQQPLLFYRQRIFAIEYVLELVLNLLVGKDLPNNYFQTLSRFPGDKRSLFLSAFDFVGPDLISNVIPVPLPYDLRILHFRIPPPIVARFILIYSVLVVHQFHLFFCPFA